MKSISLISGYLFLISAIITGIAANGYLKTTEGFTKLNVPRIRQAAAGGYIEGEYFPRRNGGIMPSEGSGQKDDVPAMLMAGEFVLNKNAVKGLFNGDLNKGIERAYAMQNRLASQGA